MRYEQTVEYEPSVHAVLHRLWRENMRNAITIAVLSMLCSGCTTDIINEFHGETRNMRGNNRDEALRCNIPGYCSGPSAAGGQFVGFGLPTQGFSVFLFYPQSALSQRVATNTAPPLVDAWLIRTNGYFDWSGILKSGDPNELRRAGGEQLDGRLAVLYRNNADFDIHVSLVGTADSTTLLRGEFKGYTRTRFDPSAPFAGLAMLFFGEGHSSAAVRPTDQK